MGDSQSTRHIIKSLAGSYIWTEEYRHKQEGNGIKANELSITFGNMQKVHYIVLLINLKNI